LTHPRQLRCVLAQLNLVVGDVDGNTSRIVAAAAAARDQFGADLVLLPELAVSGYPPEDLLFHSGMRLQVGRSLERLKREVHGITLIAGYPEYVGTKIFNSAIVIRDGAVLAKFCMTIGAAGNLRTKTARAWPEAEYMKMVSELP